MKFNQLKKSDEKMFSFQNLYILKSGLKNYIVYLSTVAMQKALLFLDNKEKRHCYGGLREKIDSDGDVNLKVDNHKEPHISSTRIARLPTPTPCEIPWDWGHF